MSDAAGWVIRDGQVVGWFEYMGTSDVCSPVVYPDRPTLQANWRKGAREYRECACGPNAKTVTVELWAEYGHDHKVCDSTLCETCSTITGRTSDWWDGE